MQSNSHFAAEVRCRITRKMPKLLRRDVQTVTITFGMMCARVRAFRLSLLFGRTLHGVSDYFVLEKNFTCVTFNILCRSKSFAITANHLNDELPQPNTSQLHLNHEDDQFSGVFVLPSSPVRRANRQDLRKAKRWSTMSLISKLSM